MVVRKKDAYWHTLARAYISMGLKPASICKCLKEVFPLTEITGRHIGAYKRRLVQDGEVEVPVAPTVNMNEAISLAKGLVNDEDRFVYDCSIGAMKRSLKCFEYKMPQESEAVDLMEEIDIWVSGLNQG